MGITPAAISSGTEHNMLSMLGDLGDVIASLVVDDDRADGRGRVDVSEVTTGDIEKFCFNPDWKMATVRGYVRDLRNLFGFGLRRDYLVKSPAAAVEIPRVIEMGKIEVHSPGQVAVVLEHLRGRDLAAMRLMALRYFAGLRSAEAHRLREEDIKAEFVEVTAEKSKTRSRRLVTIEPALRAWLALGGELHSRSDFHIRNLLHGSGVPFPKNASRHSFVSYHLAAFGSASKTALQAGHSEAILFKHYRALVDPAAAAAFWAIRPKDA